MKYVNPTTPHAHPVHRPAMEHPRTGRSRSSEDSEHFEAGVPSEGLLSKATITVGRTIIAGSVGAAALAASAFALLAVWRLSIRNAKVRDLKVENLDVKNLRVENFNGRPARSNLLEETGGVLRFEGSSAVAGSEFDYRDFE